MESVKEVRSTPKRTMLALVCGLIAGLCVFALVACGVLYWRGEIDRGVFSTIFILLSIPGSVLGYVAVALADVDQDRK